MAAYSFVQYPISSTTTGPFNVSFPYIAKYQVEVRKNTVLLVDGVGYTWPTSSTIQLTANAVNGDVIEVRRNSLKKADGSVDRLVDWANSAKITEANLDKADLQCFYLAQEALDAAANAMQLVSDGTYDATSRRIKNVANGTSAADAVNKSQLDAAALAPVTPIAASIGNTPAGNIAAVNVQAALNELDSEKIDKYFPQAPASGRLTLTSGVPVTSADVAAASTVYFTPYRGNRLDLYDGTGWSRSVFAELSQALNDATKSPAAAVLNTNYDLFVWNDAGTLRCTRGPTWNAGAVAGSDTARGTGANSTELELFEGRYVNKNAITNGPAARRGLYVGTIRTDGSVQVNDTAAKRHVWNMFNRVDRALQAALEATTNWTYSTATIRQANANAANQLDFVRGLDEDQVAAHVVATVKGSLGGESVNVFIGLDSTTTAAAKTLSTSASPAVAGAWVTNQAIWKGLPGIGRHTLVWLERGYGAGVDTWYGSQDINLVAIQSGISGSMRA